MFLSFLYWLDHEVFFTDQHPPWPNILRALREDTKYARFHKMSAVGEGGGQFYLI